MSRQERIESLRCQFTIHRRNLNRLEERKALYPITDVPLVLLNQIDYEEKEIQRIEQELQAFSVEPVEVEMAREPRSFLLARKVCQVPKAIIKQHGENIILLPNASMEFLGISDGSIVEVRNRLTGRIRFTFAYSIDRVCDVSIPQVLRSRLKASLSSTNDLEIFAVERRASVLVHEVCKAPQSKINRYGQNVIVLSQAVAKVLGVGEGRTIKVVNKRNARQRPVTVCSMNRLCEAGVPKVLRRNLGVQLGETNELELWRV
jgi:hypothetical protein